MRGVLPFAIAAALLAACGPKEEEVPEDTGPPTEGEACINSTGCEPPLLCITNGCGDDIAGTCLPAPEDCTAEMQRVVCACTGETFDNRCEAHKARRNVDTFGPCDS